MVDEINQIELIEKIENFHWKLHTTIKAHSDYSDWDCSQVQNFMRDIDKIFKERYKELKSLTKQLNEELKRIEPLLKYIPKDLKMRYLDESGKCG